MPNVELKIEGVDKVMRELGRLEGKAAILAGRGLYLEGEKIMAQSKRLVPVFEGPLRASGDVQLPRKTPHGVEVVLGYGGAASKYAIAIHEGMGPAAQGQPKFKKMPPVDAIKPWAQKKLGDEGAAWGVAKSLFKKGREGVKYLEEPFRAALVGMGERIAAHIRKGWK